MKLRTAWLVALIVIFSGCQNKVAVEPGADAAGFTAPTALTTQLNAKVAEALPLNDQQDFADARRGLIASETDLKVKGPDGNLIWDQTAYQFIQGKAPASVNPSLWRQAQLNDIHGLFKVTDGIYQLRGFDLANMSIIEGQTGWILIDPHTSKETTAKALAFARQHLEAKPVVAIIFTHSHIDHFGGAMAIMSAGEAKANKVRIIAPRGFMAEATSENVIAGTAMTRRSLYMYGGQLPRSERGHVGSGLGKEPALGTVGILAPTEIIDHTPQPVTIDGVQFIFQFVPGSEAPTELTFYLPQRKTFCGAEIYFGSHHWPIWGQQRIVEFLKKQRDIYKYIHDQTVRLANSGLTPDEIAETIDYPASLRTTFSNRGYYGTMRHNAKAVYQFYFGWYDGNPAHLNPLPPVQAANHYVEYMGGAENVLKQAQASFAKGEYRWVAEVLNRLVFAEPDNRPAKALLARTYDQLGYQSESGPWRDEYLTGAYELRQGKPTRTLGLATALDLLKQIPLSRLFDSMAVRLNGPKADGKQITINIEFTDINETYVLWLENAVLHHRRSAPDPKANATVKLTHDLYLKMAIGQLGIKDLLLSDDIHYLGSKLDLIRFFTLFDQPKADFNIVVP